MNENEMSPVEKKVRLVSDIHFQDGKIEGQFSPGSSFSEGLKG